MRAYQIDAKGLALRQSQRLGILLISNLRDIVITLLAATAVINGKMTIGMMLATQYIVGQLNAPLSRLIDFLYSAQDARLSLERMQEIYTHRDEEEHSVMQLHAPIPASPTLELVDLGFRYPGAGQPEVLRGVNQDSRWQSDRHCRCQRQRRYALKLLLASSAWGRNRTGGVPERRAQARAPAAVLSCRMVFLGLQPNIALARLDRSPRKAPFNSACKITLCTALACTQPWTLRVGSVRRTNNVFSRPPIYAAGFPFPRRSH